MTEQIVAESKCANPACDKPVNPANELDTPQEQASIVIEPHGRHGKFAARLPCGEILAISVQPFIASARALLDLGADPETLLIMRHLVSPTECLRGIIEKAAMLDVDEAGPRFRKAPRTLFFRGRTAETACPAAGVPFHHRPQDLGVDSESTPILGPQRDHSASRALHPNIKCAPHQRRGLSLRGQFAGTIAARYLQALDKASPMNCPAGVISSHR